MDKKVPSVNKLVVPAATARARVIPSKIVRVIRDPRIQTPAPAWLHSALAWLGSSFQDANHVQQHFQPYLVGADVDPYAQLGATRLFVVLKIRDQLRLSIAPDVDQNASLEDGEMFPNTDQGIRDLYLALADTAAFESVTHCYVPCRIGSDLAPDLEGGVLQSGYDPATGLRAIVNGSAVCQVVPLDEFLTTRNAQIYNPTPAIVPLVSALVYDITRHNTLGAKTFDVPAFYSRDRIAAAHYVNRLDARSVVTYSGPSPTKIFAQQTIASFERDPAWTTCLGRPVFGYGSVAGSLTIEADKPAPPVLVYDPAHAFLNGGSLQSVIHHLQQAHLLSWDRLLLLLRQATGAIGEDRIPGLVVTAADLAFELSSPPPGPILDHLDVPVVVTVTATPAKVQTPRLARAIDTIAGSAATRAIGAAANVRTPAPAQPVATQLGGVATIPREALGGTSIASIPLGTALSELRLGSNAALHTTTVVNLAEHRGAIDLSLNGLGLPLRDGVYYTFSTSGAVLSVRGDDGSTATTKLPAAHAKHDVDFVGAIVYSAAQTAVRLHPKVHLRLAAPAVGAHGVVQGAAYTLCLTIGEKSSTYDLLDATHAVIASNISVKTPKLLDGSTPRAGERYFGGFLGGAAELAVWSVPIFFTIARSDVPETPFDSTLVLDAQVSGVPAYKLQVTDSSVFVYFDVSVAANVFLASAVINSAPADRTSRAFAPAVVLMGLVRRVTMGPAQRYVFVPADDSVVIGGVRYITSVIELDELTFDPEERPYPPANWPRTRFWQFANRHDPYLDVGYTGETQDDRIATAQADTQRIAAEVERQHEPMHMYLDTNRELMTMWPIVGFPFDRGTQSVDNAKLVAIKDTVLELIANAPSIVTSAKAPPRPLEAERIAIPDELLQLNPYTAASAARTPAAEPMIANEIVTPAVRGKPVVQLATNAGAKAVTGLAAHASVRVREQQRAGVELAKKKSRLPGIEVMQEHEIFEAAKHPEEKRRPTIYGYSVCNRRTGEAYLVELIDADQSIPDRFPNPTEHQTYDPFYVRVVDLHRLVAYNMSIIVPAMVHDQYGHFARVGTTYDNLVAKTDELPLGYVYSLFDALDAYDELTFRPYGAPHGVAMMATAPTPVMFTNVPYAVADREKHGAPDAPYFVCRRKNWSSDCHLMESIHPEGSSVYLAFGGGDLIPFLLDAEFDVDKRSPAHLYKLTYTFPDRQYNAAKIVSVANRPFVVGVTTQDGVPQYTSFSIDATAGTDELSVTPNRPLDFPREIYVVGSASTTLVSMDEINARAGTTLASTGELMTLTDDGLIAGQEFQLIAYNNLVYLVRAVANVDALGAVGGLGTVSGLLIDTFVPTTSGNLALAQGARHKRSGLPYFGASYTPTTMVDTLDNLDFTSITGEKFFVPTIFVPIPELDATRGFIADISNFIGQQFWTFIYPEIVARTGDMTNGVTWDRDVNIDGEGKPVLSLQKLHFVYDPLVVMFTPNDLSHKYALQPKQQVLALTNGQIQEAICWRSANVQPDRSPPKNVRAQQIIPVGPDMDAPNIIYSAHNRPVATSEIPVYRGMSVNSFVSVSGTTYNIEESALANDQTATSFISAVSSTSNMLVGVLFDYDNNDLGTLVPYNSTESTKGIVFLNGYLSAQGYAFSSPDHFDVNDVLKSHVPLLEQIAGAMGEDVAFFNTDISRPRQFWSMTYDTSTAPGIPNFITNVPPSLVDPTFANRTRSLILSVENSVRPQQLGLMDTFSSVVSANLHLENGVTGSVFISKKADRDVASIGTNPVGPNSFPLYGLPTKYDFFLFSRDHYWTLKGATFELVDHGYAMYLVDDGSGTGTKVAKFFVDTGGNYYELYSYALFSPNGGVLETSMFTVRVSLGAPGNLSASPIIPQTPNNVNPQDLVAQINRTSNLVYAAFGPSSPGQPPAFIPIQAVAGSVQAAPIVGPPGFGGYELNVATASRQPVEISKIYSGAATYSIAGSTAVIPLSKSGRPQSPLGSLSHGLDRMLSTPSLSSADHTVVIPRPTQPAGPASAMLGGNGLGALIGTPLSCAFQGSGAIPPAIAANPTPGTTMKADDTVFYTFNALTSAVMDSTGKSATASGSQYFVDITDAADPIYAVVTLPRFTLNGNTYAVNMTTTLSDGTSRYSLVVGGKSYLFGPDNAHVTVDRTRFTFQPLTGGVYNVTFSALDAPAGGQAPAVIALTPFSITAGGATATVDVFNSAGGLNNIVLGVLGRQYAYDPIAGEVAIHAGPSTITVPLATGVAFASSTGYGYVIAFDGAGYTVNGAKMVPYSASTTGAPATHALMTAPQMFTLGGNFYTFDRDANGGYVSVTGNRSIALVNPYQFSINGAVYVIDTHVQPNTVIGGGNTYPMTSSNTQFVINGVQYTITLKQGSLNGATISGQFNIEQGNVVVLENYVYQIDNLNGRIVGNGTTYPLTASGVTYTISTADRSFTVTTEPNATTVTLGNIVYQINNTTVVGEGITYPILPYRTFVDAGTTFRIGADGVVSIPTPFALSGSAPYVRSTFTDGPTFTVNDIAAFDGTTYFRISGAVPQFTTPARVYTLRSDGVSIAAGPAKTFLGPTTGPLTPNQFAFGPQTIFFGRSQDVAAFDGQHYFAIANGQFTDTVLGATYTLSGNTAVHDGNSYEIYSNLGQGAYFQVPGGPLYYVNVAVADTGTANGDIFSVFPISGGQFVMPVTYTVTVAGGVATVAAPTLPGPTVIGTLGGSGTSLTGGFFVDPVTKITYMCVVDGSGVVFVDSNNTIYDFSTTTHAFVASVVVATGVTLAVDDQPTPAVYPVTNNQFIDGASTYSINVPIAYQNPAGPFWPMVNGRFIVPQTSPRSNVAYTVAAGTVTKGYVVSIDDQFSVDGNVVYTVNAVNVVKATNQATLADASPTQTVTAGALTYSLDETSSTASIQPAGLVYSTATTQFSISYNGLPVTYTVGPTSATDDRSPANTFPLTVAGTIVTFTDPSTAVTFRFDRSGNNPITVRFAYVNHFFIDALTGTTYYIDVALSRVEALSYLPESTHYAFTPADNQTYLIHYDHVDVEFPVIAGPHVNAGLATVGANTFSVSIDEVIPISGDPAIATNTCSFEINGNLYTIAGTPAGGDYSACSIAGNDQPARPFLSANTFRLGDPSVTYTLQLDAANLPRSIHASFAVRPSQNLLSVNDDVYILTYNTVSTGSLRGQGQAAIPIAGSSFTLTNRFDSTKAKFIFANLDIYNAGSVVGQFTAYLAPTFVLGGVRYTFDPVRSIVTDDDKRPYPLIPNPTMFSINGSNYVIDSNRIPHAIIGNNNLSPLSTDVTVEAGEPIPSSTFTLNGQIYKYTESAAHDLLTITGTKSYMVAQPALTFKLDSSLVLALDLTPPAAGNFAGTVVPIGTILAGTTVVANVYAGTPESGGADFFTYKNVLYTFVRSGAIYVAVQKSYTVYAAAPAAGQQQLAVFDLDGTTYLVTDGSTAGTPAAGIHPSTMWAATATSSTETQFGLVYGFSAQPTTVTQSATGLFQFAAADASGTSTLYDIIYTAGDNRNVVKVDVPSLLPTFTQTGPFTFTPSYPLMFETGGYNAFTTFVAETSTPSLSFAGAYKTPVRSTDPLVDSLITEQGDFSLEFWHSIPASIPSGAHPVTYRASSPDRRVFFIDVDFENDTDIFVGINDTVLHAVAAPPVFSSGWRHVALSYSQPYTMACQGAGFEVKRGDNFNFNRDFSIAMTFSASDVTARQGLLYKGSGADTTPPELAMSYRVAVENGAVTLQLTDGSGNISPVFVGPAITNGTFFELIIVKHTITLAGRDDSSDPYAAPFDTSDLGPAASSGMTGETEGFEDGTITISNVAPAGTGATTKVADFFSMLNSPPAKAYRVIISVRPVNADGTATEAFVSTETDQTVDDSGLIVRSTGNRHLLIGAAFDDAGQAMPLGDTSGRTGNIRKVYLFNGAIDRAGVKNADDVVVPIALATADDLRRAGLVGYWVAAYDPDGLITSPLDAQAVAISTNQTRAFLAPITGHEAEGTRLFVNGYPMTLTQVDASTVPNWNGYAAGSTELLFDAGQYRLAEISVWRMARQAYQVVDDMFGRLIPTNEPLLAIYLSGSFLVQAINAPILPMKKYIDNIAVTNPVASMDLEFSPASLDLAGCPAVGRCGPLITPNLYTPPGVALTVCDSVPFLATYSVTLNNLTGSLAGEINEAYVYIKDDVLTLYAGKKVGDLVLSWVSQEQGDVQIIGYVEGAPPAPMANLTNKASYANATSVTLSAPTSVTVKYGNSDDYSKEEKNEATDATGFNFGLGFEIAPFGFGLKSDAKGAVMGITLGLGIGGSWTEGDGSSWSHTASNKLDEGNKYTVKLQGTLAPFTNDSFMAGLNSVSTPSTTVGTPSSRTAILPNPNLGGFTSSNPPAPLPRAPTEEKFGARMYQPTPYGQAFVTSQTLDVYQQTLVQTNTVFGYVRLPNAQIPRDLNIVSYRINSKYLRPGVLDGMIGYAYNPATLPNGTRTYTTSTGDMAPLYDKNFSPGTIGHDASYMRVVEAYKLKRQIDQQAFNAIALYGARYEAKGDGSDRALTPGLDFYNEYVWTARGGTQEVKHTYTTSYEEAYSVSKTSTDVYNINFNVKLAATTVTVIDFKYGHTWTMKDTLKYSFSGTGTSSFDITASFDGIENDTQMRYACANDAHFVMKFNSMFNPSNQSGLNLVIGSDGLVYQIAPSVQSGAGLPLSNNIDDSMTFMQPPPAYSSGNANGLTGTLEQYDRPGKVKQFRTYAFFLQPSQDNADNFWDAVVDPVWLKNSDEADARAMRSARENRSLPWRLLYRVTYCERFVPPISAATFVVPQITPVMAVPVLEPVSDFLFMPITAPGPRPARNPANDIEDNIVLAAPTSSGASAGGTTPTGTPILPNNVILFDLVKNTSSIVSWGDSANAKLLTQLLTSVLGLNTVVMSPVVTPGSTKVNDVLDPVGGAPLYSIYTDANGLTLNVPVNAGITVYQDVNGNPIQYFDGKQFHSLQADYVASTDGTVMVYIQPPSTYDPSVFDLAGDYDLYAHPGDEWRYYLVSGFSANMTSEPTVTGHGPFLSSTGAAPFTGFTPATAMHASSGTKQVKGYVLVQGLMQWPNLNSNAEVFADVQTYKAMSLLDTFPVGDPAVLVAFLAAQYPDAPFASNAEIGHVFARNIVSYFNALQQALLPQ